MELELATTEQIADELANRGLQFVIAIQVLNSESKFKVHVCVDGEKDKQEVAEAVAPLFDVES